MRYGTEGQPDIGGGSREELCLKGPKHNLPPLFKEMIDLIDKIERW